MTADQAIGRPVPRLEGPAKVTGTARYTAEISLPHCAHAVLVGATVPSGRITRLDTSRAERATGVFAVLTHHNLPKIATAPKLLPSGAGFAAPGQSFFPLQDETVHYAGQPVAIVVADTLERAEHAATLVHVEYEARPHVTTIDRGRDDAYEPEAIMAGFVPGRMVRGEVEAGLAEADVRIEATYRFAAGHHNPIEPSATCATWDDDVLTLWDATQGPGATQQTVAALLGLPPSKVRVITPFVGGSFGGKAMIWHHPTLAALASQHVRSPVKLVLTREQMFTSCGHREEQEQHVELGSTPDGRLTALRHHKISPTSHFDDWAEPSLGVASQTYACASYEGVYHLIHSNTMTPTFMRAPGEATGMFALECAMDELAHRLGIDPVELRLRNHADTDPATGKPWSSKGLEECYRRGSELFEWDRRTPEPRSRRDGHILIGTGMATAGYPVYAPATPQRARARVYPDGSAVVQTGASEFGTGAATVMAQVAADALGLPLDAVRFEYGDTDLPSTAAAVGSSGAGAIGSAVHTAAAALRDQLIGQAIADGQSPLRGADPADVIAAAGQIGLRDRPDVADTYADLLHRNMMADAEAVGTWQPPNAHDPAFGHALMTFGAQFAEVAVDADLGTVRVTRMTGVFAPGRVLNPTTARGQLMGGMLWGLGHALLEASHMDPGQGRWAGRHLGEYLVPVNADAPDVTVETIDVADNVVNPLGVKGVGEIGMVGAAAAIASAIFHATGRRVRHLPITIEDLL